MARRLLRKGNRKIRSGTGWVTSASHVLYFTWYYSLFISWIWMSLHFYPDLISLNNTFIIYARDTPPFVQSIQWCASMAFWIHRIPIFNFAKSGILYFRLNWNRTEVFDITMSSLQDCEVNQSDTLVSKAIQKEICSKSFMQKENPVQ